MKLEENHLFISDETDTENVIILSDFARRYHSSSKLKNVDEIFHRPEFEKDFAIIKHIKRQLSFFDNSEKINLRLFLNNIILFTNAFDLDAAKIILLFRINKRQHRERLKAALISLNLLDPIEWETIDVDEDFMNLIQETINK